MAWTALALSGVAFARTGAALGGMTGQSYLIRRNLMRIIPTMHLDPTFAGDAQLLDVTRGAARCMVSDMLPKRIAFGVIGLAVLLVVGWVFLPSVALRLVMLISAGGSFGLTYFASFLSESGREVLGGFTDVFNPVSLIDAPHDR